MQIFRNKNLQQKGVWLKSSNRHCNFCEYKTAIFSVKLCQNPYNIFCYFSVFQNQWNKTGTFWKLKTYKLCILSISREAATNIFYKRINRSEALQRNLDWKVDGFNWNLTKKAKENSGKENSVMLQNALEGRLLCYGARDAIKSVFII